MVGGLIGFSQGFGLCKRPEGAILIWPTFGKRGEGGGANCSLSLDGKFIGLGGSAFVASKIIIDYYFHI